MEWLQRTRLSTNEHTRPISMGRLVIRRTFFGKSLHRDGSTALHTTTHTRRAHNCIPGSRTQAAHWPPLASHRTAHTSQLHCTHLDVHADLTHKAHSQLTTDTHTRHHDGRIRKQVRGTCIPHTNTHRERAAAPLPRALAFTLAPTFARRQPREPPRGSPAPTAAASGTGAST